MKHIRKRDLIRVFLRSFYIQGAWNYERMMGLGLCFCLIPIGNRLYKNDKEKTSFLNRYLDFFNSHPYMASFALGALAQIEQQSIQKDWSDKRPITVFKDRICGPLGAIGDTVFWKILKPLSACLGIILSITFGWIGILLAFIFYNVFHIYARIIGVYLGYKKGFDIIRDLSLSKTQKYSEIFYSINNVIIGILMFLGCHWSYSQELGTKGFGVFIFMLLFSLLIKTKKKISAEMNIIIVLSVSVIIGLMI